MLPQLGVCPREFVKKLHVSLAKKPYPDRGQVLTGQPSFCKTTRPHVTRRSTEETPLGLLLTRI